MVAAVVAADLQETTADMRRVASKQERVEKALERRSSFLGTTDHNTLMEYLQSLRKEMEQLRFKELLLLRWQLTPTPLGSNARTTTGPSHEKIGGSGCIGAGGGGGSCRPKETKKFTFTDHFDHGAQGGMEIFVRAAGRGDGVAVQAKPSDTVLDVKKKLQRIDWIPAGSRQLSFEGKTPDDERTLSEINTTAKSTHLVMHGRTDGRMPLFIRQLTGKTVMTFAKGSDTVLDLKEAIKEMEGKPLESFQLVFDGKRLEHEHDKTLSDYDITDHSTVHLVFRLVGGKPVILLYPSASLDVTVTLELSPLWKISALYPRPLLNKRRGSEGSEAVMAGGQKCEWSVHASPDGSLEDLNTGKEYPYLFWEAAAVDNRVTRSFGLEDTKSFCVAGDAAGVFLDGALERLGLNARERCDMITYWLPQLELSPFNEIFFVHTVRYEQAARLTIFPAPDVTIRIFMAFRGVDSYDVELDNAIMDDLKTPSRHGFVAVEWGGMNLNGAKHH